MQNDATGLGMGTERASVGGTDQYASGGSNWQDWSDSEKLRRIHATRTIPITTPTEGEIADLLAAYKARDPGYRQRIIRWAMSGQVARMNANTYIGDIETTNNSIRSIISHGTGPLKVLVIQHLDEILQNAVPYGQGQDGTKNFINMVHRLTFDEKEYIAYVTVQEDQNGNRTYDVEFGGKERLSRELPGGAAAAARGPADADPLDVNTVAYPGADVNTRASIGGGYLDDWSVRAQDAFNRGMKTEAQIAEQLGIPYGAWTTHRPFGSLGENGRDIRTSDLLDFQSEWHHVGKRFDEVLFLDPDQFYDVRSAYEIDDKQDAALFFYYTKMRQAPREIDARKLTAEERDALNLQERDIWKAFDEKVTPALEAFVRAVAANAEVDTLRTLASAYEKAMHEHKRLADDVAKQFLASIGKPRAYRNERPRKVGGARSSIAGGTVIPGTKFTIAEARQAIRNQNKAHPNGCTNRQTGHVAFINGHQINEMTNAGSMAKTKNNGFTIYEHLHAVAKAPTLYENATLVRDDPDTKNGDKNVRILRYAAPIVIERPNGPIEATAWLTVKTSERHGHRIYSLEVLELEEARQRSANTASSALPRARNLTDTIAYPPEEVNQENADDLRSAIGGIERGARAASLYFGRAAVIADRINDNIAEQQAARRNRLKPGEQPRDRAFGTVDALAKATKRPPGGGFFVWDGRSISGF